MARTKLGVSDGRSLAIQLLHDLEENTGEFNPYSIDPKDRESGKPQLDIVGQYLTAARSHGSAAEAGVTAVLSDFLASARAGCIPDSAVYEEWLFPGETA